MGSKDRFQGYLRANRWIKGIFVQFSIIQWYFTPIFIHIIVSDISLFGYDWWID